jgi:hypothetical protein
VWTYSINQIFPVFSIDIHIKDKLLLIKIQEYFGFGIVFLLGNNAQFRVFNLVDLFFLIDHFNSYSLLGWKLDNYKIWLEIVHLIFTNKHLTKEGLAKIWYYLKQEKE